MLNLFGAVACSVLVSVLLKLAPRWRVAIDVAIACNYACAMVATVLLLQPWRSAPPTAQWPWPSLLALGLLLPTIFLVLARSVREAGIVRSDVAQRLSLLLPLLAAFVLFGERASATKLAGGALGLLALLALVWRGRAQPAPVRAGAAWPLLVFAGFGVIDILFKRVAASGLALGLALQVVFVLALVVAVLISAARRSAPDWRSCGAGLVLGLFNFGNILFYLRAHRALPDAPALVFAGMNLGVVVLGALTGLVLFGERLGRINLAGLGLALVAITLLARG